MVDRIRKITTDPLHLARKDNAGEDREGHGRQEPHDEEEHDEFSKAPNFKKWTSDSNAARIHHPSLWKEKPLVFHEPSITAKLETRESEQEQKTTSQEINEDEEPTVSQSISFFHTSGLRHEGGRPRWITIGFYVLALLGFLLTISFVINALL